MTVEHTGPYKVTVERRTRVFVDGAWHDEPMRIVSERVYATLDEARDSVQSTVMVAHEEAHGPSLRERAPDVSIGRIATGGAIELPDGATITVEPTTWEDLARLAGGEGS